MDPIFITSSSSEEEDKPKKVVKKTPKKKVDESSEKSTSQSEEEAEEEEEEQEFPVEEIVDHQQTGNKIFYRVKWEGYPSSENTWEDARHLKNCQTKINEYWEKIRTKTIPTKRVNDVPFAIEDDDDSQSSENEITKKGKRTNQKSKKQTKASVPKPASQQNKNNKDKEKGKLKEKQNEERERRREREKEKQQKIAIEREKQRYKKLGDLDKRKGIRILNRMKYHDEIFFVVVKDGKIVNIGEEKIKKKYTQQLLDFYESHIEWDGNIDFQYESLIEAGK